MKLIRLKVRPKRFVGFLYKIVVNVSKLTDSYTNETHIVVSYILLVKFGGGVILLLVFLHLKTVFKQVFGSYRSGCGAQIGKFSLVSKSLQDGWPGPFGFHAVIRSFLMLTFMSLESLQ